MRIQSSVFIGQWFNGEGAFVGEVRVTLPEDLVPMVAPTLETLGRTHRGLSIVLLITSEMMDVGREADIALRLGTSSHRHISLNPSPR